MESLRTRRVRRAILWGVEFALVSVLVLFVARYVQHLAAWAFGMKAMFRAGLLVVLAGALIAVATWPHAQTDALGATYRHSAMWADVGVAVAMLGLFLVVLTGIASGMRRVQSINQDDKP